MHDRIPEPLKALVEQLARLPGLGPKSAMRAAMTLLKWPEAETRRLGRGIHDLRDNLHLCSRCGGLSSTDPCPVCADAGRARDTLCLVTEWDSMLTLDEGGFYRGQYMILGGLLAPLERMDSESLDHMTDEVDSAAWYTPDEAREAITHNSLAEKFLLAWLSKREKYDKAFDTCRF